MNLRACLLFALLASACGAVESHRLLYLQPAPDAACLDEVAEQDGMGLQEEVSFAKATGVWPEGRLDDVNRRIVFTADFEAGKDERPTLKLVAWYSYHVRLNGAFVAAGPARGPKGFFRADEIALSPRPGKNRLEIEVANYNVPSFYLLKQPPFLKAEVVADGRVLVASGATGGFTAHENLSHVQRTPRYSYQRHYSEAYRLPAPEGPALKLSSTAEPRLLPRRVPLPDFACVSSRLDTMARVRRDPTAEVRRNAQFKGKSADPRKWFFPPDELTVDSEAYAQQLVRTDRRPASADEAAAAETRLSSGTSATFDLGRSETGFPALTVKVSKPGRLVLEFDELLDPEGRLLSVRAGCKANNVVIWDFTAPGTYDVTVFEPYVMRYLTLAVPEAGEMAVSRPRLVTYKSPLGLRARFRSSDPALEKIFNAARESFRQNAVDVLMDCPSRERAGWNCDACFTSTSAALLTGSGELERLFLENFARAEKFDQIPDGMLPMCYPADAIDAGFIPNWAMWFVLQTDRYLRRTGDRETVGRLRPRLEKLIGWFWKFRNPDGLLERLEGGAFIEWSRANKLVQDVSYPANMTWAAVLEAMDRLYGRPDLVAEARHVRETVRKQSWTGRWFCDNAVRGADGTLRPSGECTEVCQYYAFLFGTATPGLYPDLWRTLVTEFGPSRSTSAYERAKRYPEVWPINSFPGVYLRLILLVREGNCRQALSESKGFFLRMAESSGALWEGLGKSASTVHGFASSAAPLLVEAAVGATVDWPSKTLTLKPTDAADDLYEVTLPVGAASLTVRRRMVAGRPVVETSVPDGWKVRRLPGVESPVCRATDFKPAEKSGKGIQAAIDAAAKSGGGRVVLEAGTYPCATLYFKSNVELHLKQGAVLLGSDRWSDYDDVDDPRIGKVPERSKKAFLAAIGCENVAITGEGTVDGQGVAFYDTNVPAGAMFKKPAHPRTRMCEFVACRNVRFEGVEFKDSPGWTFWIRNCENVTCRNLRIHGDQRMINNDGLHFDGCRHVRVSDCDIKTGDDCVIMRANRMPGGSSVCEDMIVENCRLDSNCQAIRLGCPSDDTIRDGLFRKLAIRGNNGIASIHPVRYLQPNCTGYCRMENLRVVDCDIDVRGQALLFRVDPGIRLRKFGGVAFSNLVMRAGAKVTLAGTADTPLEGVTFDAVRTPGGKVTAIVRDTSSWESD